MAEHTPIPAKDLRLREPLPHIIPNPTQAPLKAILFFKPQSLKIKKNSYFFLKSYSKISFELLSRFLCFTHPYAT